MKVALEELVHSEIRGVGRDAATCDHLGTFPESEEAFLLIQNSPSFEEGQFWSTSLQVSLYIIQLV